ncbi:hypothetical protein K2173_020201 [Erythroxylum novogranatense]|uniref:Uncharacterized protein n=1 Tax=Erythroxylum novogranatense TaxID=1862640 RepID=A0AAV8U7B5_9ROSI|nr:hypothetical protein K2173_020201 [Erythroxylum novogranatense]
MGEPSLSLGSFPPLQSTVTAGCPPASNELEEGEILEKSPVGSGAWRDKAEQHCVVINSCESSAGAPELIKRPSRSRSPNLSPEGIGLSGAGVVVREAPGETSSSPPSRVQTPMAVGEGLLNGASGARLGVKLNKRLRPIWC